VLAAARDSVTTLRMGRLGLVMRVLGHRKPSTEPDMLWLCVHVGKREDVAVGVSREANVCDEQRVEHSVLKLAWASWIVGRSSYTRGPAVRGTQRRRKTGLDTC
jgi:hypothetical protein